MRHIHTSIVSRHLATRGNNKTLRTLPPHISSSEERFPRLTRRTLAQLRTNKSPFLKSYLHKVDTTTHPSSLCPHIMIELPYRLQSTTIQFASFHFLTGGDQLVYSTNCYIDFYRHNFYQSVCLRVTWH